MRLYHLTGDDNYLRCAEYFLRERGKDPDFFDKQRRNDGKKPLIAGLERFPKSYYQVHMPIEKQDTAEGHAVRLVYMCTALADLAATTKNQELVSVCKRIWRNIIDKRMYITGGIGSTVIGESFTLDYDLPNDTMYCETCASIGLIFFAKQMLRIEHNSEYADVIEKALYNTALAGMSLDGKHFFYVNPLEVVPDKSEKDPTKSHVKVIRPEWLGCACCPPNLARMIASLDKYIYLIEEQIILINLFVKSYLECSNDNGKITIVQETEYPKDGKIKLKVSNESSSDVTIAIRIPGWADEYKGAVDDKTLEVETRSGYWNIEIGVGQHNIELELEMMPKRWYANSKVSEDIGKVAVSRGPQIYCVEGVDNGDDLHCLYLPENESLNYIWQEDLFGGIGVIEADGIKLGSNETTTLYTSRKNNDRRTPKIRMIPYYAWGNRGKNEMRVWINEC